MICLLGIAVLLATATCQPTLLEIDTALVATLANVSQEVATLDCSHVDRDVGSIMQYILYNRENQLNGIVLDDTNLNQVDPLRQLIFIIHGWLQDGSKPWLIQMKNIYLQKFPANIIVVDWSAYANLHYGEAVCDVPYIGQLVGDFIYNLVTSVHVQLENIQINGFSLGGHVGGFAGKQVQKRSSDRKIARIIGLDIAGPGFEGRDANERLANTDASCVQGIHTSGRTFGYQNAYGTVDFQLNYNRLGCGIYQQGCPFNPGVPSNDILPYVFCHHIRAIAYFNEAINSSRFIGVLCSSLKFRSGQCTSTKMTVMGDNFPCDVYGEYYLTTNAISPFARGIYGTET